MVVNPRSIGVYGLMLILLAACSSREENDTPQQTVETSAPRSTQFIDVNGVVPQFEPPSRIGNTDYDVLGRHYKVWNGIQHYEQDGTASWYGPGFHGKYTSNGDLYNQNDISAAHKNLPLPSYLRVTNLDNGRRLIVRVNDRGPFHGDRILDLSHGAASRLGILGPGTAHVHVELMQPAMPENANEILAKSDARTIQLLATNNITKAQSVAKDVERLCGVSPKVVTIDRMYKLHVGPLQKQQAQMLLAKLKDSGFRGAFFIN
jgi:rare lipoprotein A